MASPQLEYGYIRIACELVEALARTNLSAHESRLLWCIIRKTYGWRGKKRDWIAGSQFRKVTGLDRRHVHRGLHKLANRRIIVIQTDDKNNRTYGIQKDYDRWVLSSKEMTGAPKQMTHASSKEAHTKDTITKDTLANADHSRKISHLTGRRKTKSGPPASGFTESRALYIRLFTERFGAKPDFDGRDGALLSGLLKSHGSDEVQYLLSYFFEHPPAWIKKDSKFTIPHFKAVYTQLLAQSRNGFGQPQQEGFVG